MNAMGRSWSSASWPTPSQRRPKQPPDTESRVWMRVAGRLPRRRRRARRRADLRQRPDPARRPGFARLGGWLAGLHRREPRPRGVVPPAGPGRRVVPLRDRQPGRRLAAGRCASARSGPPTARTSPRWPRKGSSLRSTSAGLTASACSAGVGVRGLLGRGRGASARRGCGFLPARAPCSAARSAAAAAKSAASQSWPSRSSAHTRSTCARVVAARRSATRSTTWPPHGGVGQEHLAAVVEPLQQRHGRDVGVHVVGPRGRRQTSENGCGGRRPRTGRRRRPSRRTPGPARRAPRMCARSPSAPYQRSTNHSFSARNRRPSGTCQSR